MAHRSRAMPLRQRRHRARKDGNAYDVFVKSLMIDMGWPGIRADGTGRTRLGGPDPDELAQTAVELRQHPGRAGNGGMRWCR